MMTDKSKQQSNMEQLQRECNINRSDVIKSQSETKKVIFIKKGATYKSHRFGKIGTVKNNETFNKEVDLHE